MQTAEQVPAEISCAFMHGMLVQSLSVGQAPGFPAGMAVSQVSKGSTVPFPHVDGQSSSCMAEFGSEVAPFGQHPSRGPPIVRISLCPHAALQPLPVSESVVQATWSSHDWGQAPGLPGAIAVSHDSPMSMTPLPQKGTFVGGPLSLLPTPPSTTHGSPAQPSCT